MAVDDLANRGFIKVTCNACENPDVWLRCNGCEKSDHFLLKDGRASCSCGQTYAFATCTCGAKVEGENLSFVPFKEGPMGLADLEVDWRRVALLGIGLMVFVAGVFWGLFR